MTSLLVRLLQNALWIGLAVALVVSPPALVRDAAASPGVCVGPVCADDISRSAKHHWQLRLRLSDQQGHHERVVVDCRSGDLSPRSGLVDRGYGTAAVRRACRLAGEATTPTLPAVGDATGDQMQSS